VSRPAHGATGADHNNNNNNGARGHDHDVPSRDDNVGSHDDDHQRGQFDDTSRWFHDNNVGICGYIIDNATRCQHDHVAAAHHDPDHRPAL
jgi:hypothetical protein